MNLKGLKKFIDCYSSGGDMTVEIREIIIKTEVVTESSQDTNSIDFNYLEKMKGKIVKECIDLIKRDRKLGFRNR